MRRKKVAKQVLAYAKELRLLQQEKNALTTELNLLEHLERVQSKSRSTQN